MTQNLPWAIWRNTEKCKKLRNPFVTKRRFMLILIRDFTIGRRFVWKIDIIRICSVRRVWRQQFWQQFVLASQSRHLHRSCHWMQRWWISAGSRKSRQKHRNWPEAGRWIARGYRQRQRMRKNAGPTSRAEQRQEEDTSTNCLQLSGYKLFGTGVWATAWYAYQ